MIRRSNSKAQGSEIIRRSNSKALGSGDDPEIELEGPRGPHIELDATHKVWHRAPCSRPSSTLGMVLARAVDAVELLCQLGLNDGSSTSNPALPLLGRLARLLRLTRLIRLVRGSRILFALKASLGLSQVRHLRISLHISSHLTPSHAFSRLGLSQAAETLLEVILVIIVFLHWVACMCAITTPMHPHAPSLPVHAPALYQRARASLAPP